MKTWLTTSIGMPRILVVSMPFCLFVLSLYHATLFMMEQNLVWGLIIAVPATGWACVTAHLIGNPKEIYEMKHYRAKRKVIRDALEELDHLKNLLNREYTQKHKGVI